MGKVQELRSISGGYKKGGVKNSIGSGEAKDLLHDLWAPTKGRIAGKKEVLGRGGRMGGNWNNCSSINKKYIFEKNF